jgi:transposase
MINDKELLERAKYIINGATIDDTAKYFKSSPRTIQLQLKKLEEKAKSESSDINWKEVLRQVLIAKEISQQKGRIKGGTIGRRESNWTQDEIEEIAKYIISNGLTLKEASEVLEKRFGYKYQDIPKSTLYDVLGRLNNPELRTQLECHYENNKHGLRGIEENKHNYK